MSRFDIVTPNEPQKKAIEALKNKVKELEATVNEYCFDGRYKALAMTKLEECSMFLTKSVTHDKGNWK